MILRPLGPLALGLLLIAAPLGCACSGGKNQSISAQSAATVKGTVSFRERITLQNPEVTVRLVDVTGDKSGLPPLATQTYQPQSGPPYPFVLNYTIGDIQRERKYAVTATITAGGKIEFETAEPVEVLTQGKPTTAELVLTRATR